MRKKAKEFLKHPLIYGSTIVVLGNLFVNFFNFLFNLFMSRNLSVVDYGVLASVISLMSFPMLVVSAINPMVIKFAGNYFATDNFPFLHGIYMKIKKALFLFGLLFFTIFILFLSGIGNFFHINNNTILIITDFIIFLSFIGVVNTAFLQAKLAFTFQILINFINTILKLALGIILVLLGFSATGAVFSILAGGIVAYILSFIPLRFIFDRRAAKIPKIPTKELFAYGVPSGLTMLGLTSFISTDILLVKHFFDAHQAGIYAGLSLVGRVIFYISAPVGGVMFPLIIQKHSRNENFTNTFKLSLFLVVVPSILLSIFYALFPEFSILFFLKKEEYLVASPFIALFALFISLFSLLSILSNFYLSIKRTKIFIPIMIGAFLQIILIILYHKTFLQIITISIVIMVLLIIGFLVYYPKATKIKH